MVSTVFKVVNKASPSCEVLASLLLEASGFGPDR